MPFHIPALRRGRPYESLEKTNVLDFRTGAVLATVSQVNAGIIRKDVAKFAESRAALRKFSTAQLLDICSTAAEHFLNGTLPLGDKGETQSPSQYIETLSATSGLPYVMVRRNMAKIHDALVHMKTVLNGLTRGLDARVLDGTLRQQFGTRLSFYPTTLCLGLVMRSCGRALVFGDKATTTAYAGNPAIQIHGPGYSKLIIGEDEIERWPEFVDLIASTISDNGGRSCINVSTVVVPRHANEIARALAEKLGPIAPRSAMDEQARLSGFANPKMAAFIDTSIEDGLKTPGATDVTAPFRGGPRLVQFEGASFVRPTLVQCDSFAHPLANREFLCPYASVVSVPQSEMLRQIGPSLAVTAITKDPAFIEQLMESPLIERLNLGPISTLNISWDQPHEGNLFEFLYRRRSLDIVE
jgi:hypothetical protein